jgi:hypothetical protein
MIISIVENSSITLSSNLIFLVTSAIYEITQQYNTLIII